MSNSCSIVGSHLAPIDITVWEATPDDQHGNQLFQGNLNEGDPAGPWDTANGRIVYQYRSLPDGTVSQDVFSSCIDGSPIEVP
jgi:hypothetical protein